MGSTFPGCGRVRISSGVVLKPNYSTLSGVTLNPWKNRPSGHVNSRVEFGTQDIAFGLFKDSALVSIIGVNELMRQSQIATSLTFRPFEFYTVTALIYIVLTLCLSQVSRYLEFRMNTE